MTRCAHSMLAGMCVVPTCLHWDGRNPPFAAPPGPAYEPVAVDRRCRNGRKARVLALLSTEWAPFHTPSTGIERKLDRTLLSNLCARGEVEKRGTRRRQEYRRPA